MPVKIDTFGPVFILVAMFLLTETSSTQTATPSVSPHPSAGSPLTLDHAWIVVTTRAPQRAALEQAGFRIAPTINRHDGQGTASVTIEFLNGFLELIYPDPEVPVSPALQAGAEKFRLKSRWRDTGYSPIGIVFARTPATPQKFPFATWKISADWMEPGTFIELVTPKDMAKAVSLSISSHSVNAREANEARARDPDKRAMFLHPNGARRLTRLRVLAPTLDAFPPASAYVAEHTPVKFERGSGWLLEVTLDNAAQNHTADLRPDLPMDVHY
jgi:Glyoxalase-like domain